MCANGVPRGGSARTQPPLPLPLQGHTAVVAALLGGGADGGARDAIQGTPLYHCANGRHLGIARMLLEVGCPPSVCVTSGQQALHFASQSNHPAFVELLLDQGVAVDPRTSQGHSAPLHALRLHAWQRRGRSDPALRGANPNTADEGGHSCLMRLPDQLCRQRCQPRAGAPAVAARRQTQRR